MEGILMRVVGDCGTKNSILRQAAQDAHDFLLAHQGGAYVEMYELREKCLSVIEECLELKGNRLAQDGLDGLFFILRDNQLHSLEGTKETVEQCLPMQVLHTLHSLPDWYQEPTIQCHCLTLVLQLVCSSAWVISTQVVTSAIQLCLGTFAQAQHTSVRMAARASVSQIVTSYCTGLYKEQVEDADLNVVYKEVTCLLTFCSEKLACMSSSVDDNPSLLLVVDAILAILVAQNLEIQKYDSFVSLVWKQLSPSLIEVLGTPAMMTEKRSVVESGEEGTGRGKVGVGKSPLFGTPELAKIVYLVCGELLRLFGGLSGMSSVLESLFHRVFLFVPVTERGETLKVFKKIFASPEGLADVFRNFLSDEGSLNLNLWKIILDSIVECSRCPDLAVATAAVECTDSILASWLCLCEESCSILPPQFVDDINNRFKSLKHTETIAFCYPILGEKPRLAGPLFSQGSEDSPPDTSASSPTRCSVSEETFHEQSNSDSTPSDEKESYDECMRSVAERIGSALRKYEKKGEESVASQERFVSIHQLLLEEEKRNAPALRLPTTESERELVRSRRMVSEMLERMPEWLSLKSVIEVDESIQNFASSYCKAYMEEQESEFQKTGTSEFSVLNADAVYLTTFAALKLVHRLNHARHSEGFGAEGSSTEDSFAREILQSRCIVYAPEGWVRGVCKEILSSNARHLLESRSRDSMPGSALVNLIEDYAGTTGDRMRDVERLEKLHKAVSYTRHCTAARKLCRYLLTGSWDGMMGVLTSLIEAVREGSGKLLPSILRSLRKPGGQRKRSQAMLLVDGLTSSLLALQKLANLCIHLKLQSRSGWIFRELVEVSCPLDELRAVSAAEGAGGLKRHLPPIRGVNKHPKWNMRVPDVLSIEIVLTSGIDAGSHSPECWRHIIRCCEYVWEADRFFFSERKWKGGKQKEKKHKDAPSPNTPTEGPQGLFSSETTTFLTPPTTNYDSASQLISDLNKQHSDALHRDLVCRVLTLLGASIDSFFEDTSRCLNLRALSEFVEALVNASQNRLFYSLGVGFVEPWCLLQRLSRTVMRACQSGRPLSHLLRIWPPVAAHFVEASCSEDAMVAGKAVECLHECVASLLSARGEELEGFHFNELLLSPLQNILCLDMSDFETQDQVVCVMAEFVESFAHNIHSGWKPLFGALKAVRSSYCGYGKTGVTEVQAQRMQRTVLDLFETFLKIENWDVFCFASLDCIGCLIQYIQAPNVSVVEEETEADRTSSLYEPTLACIRRLHALLASLFALNRLPVFHMLHRLMLREQSLQEVDRVFPTLFDSSSVPHLKDVLPDGFFRIVTGGDWLFNSSQVSWLPRMSWSGLPLAQQTIVEAWVSLLEGVVGAVVTCPRGFQPQLIHTLHSMLDSLRLCPGLEFGSYCLCHSVLPMMQQWLRREARVSTGWRENSPSVRNFKQAIGLITDLVVSYVQDDWSTATPGMREKLLEETLILLTECVSQPSEVISRLGCSCMRHLVISTGDYLSEAGWKVLCRSLWNAIDATLKPLRVVMNHFKEGSKAYYGDFGRVQVALRKDSNPREARRVRCLAQQVFLLDSQKFEENLEDREDLLSQSCRSIILLLHKNDQGDMNDPDLIRLPFRDVVIGLLSQQLLLQLIGSILLSGTDLVVSGISSLLMRQITSSSPKHTPNSQLPGFLRCLNGEHLSALLLCLEGSFQVALDMDSRPGIKFLFQRVFNSTVAANLYKQAVTSWTILALCLFEMGRRSALKPSEVRGLCRRVGVEGEGEGGRAGEKVHIQGLVKDSCAIGMRVLSSTYYQICQELKKVEVMATKRETERAEEEAEPLVFLLASPEEAKHLGGSTSSEQEGGEGGGVEGTEGEEEVGETKTTEKEEETVYRVVTNESLSQVLAEYKKHKLQATMPPAPVVRAGEVGRGEGSGEEGEGEIDDDLLQQQQDASALRDGEARCLAWSEMGAGILQLLLAQPDADFRRFLPAVYPSIVLLAATSSQNRIRQVVADVLYRLDEVFNFASDTP